MGAWLTGCLYCTVPANSEQVAGRRRDPRWNEAWKLKKRQRDNTTTVGQHQAAQGGRKGIGAGQGPTQRAQLPSPVVVATRSCRRTTTRPCAEATDCKTVRGTPMGSKVEPACPTGAPLSDAQADEWRRRGGCVSSLRHKCHHEPHSQPRVKLLVHVFTPRRVPAYCLSSAASFNLSRGRLLSHVIFYAIRGRMLTIHSCMLRCRLCGSL